MDYLVLLRPERKSMNNGIKKICKQNYIGKEFFEMYLKVQNEILDEVNKQDPKATHKDKINTYFCTSVLISRIFELNLEFVQIVKKEFYHSANALTRQMIEVYLISALLNQDESYCDTLIGKNTTKKIPPFRNIIDDYIDKKNQIPLLGKGLTKDIFINGIKEDYKMFSRLFHPKEDSFVQNIWVADNKKDENWVNTRTYKGNNEGKDSVILLFPKKTPFHSEYIKKMIHSFYVYSKLSFDEVKKIKAKL